MMKFYPSLHLLFSLPLLAVSLNSCSQSEAQVEQSEQALEPAAGVRDYWSQGPAEISTYEVQQNRYRELHPGTLVSLFVGEEFLTDVQVKNEKFTNPNSTPILKNIQMREFNTGVYSYYQQHSSFAPWASQPSKPTLKVSAASLDWCGQTHAQINWKGAKNAYQFQQFSYFEYAGDRSLELAGAIPEESLFTTLRMNPQHLPQGEFKLIPALNLIATQHWEAKTYPAQGTLEEGRYRVKIPDLQRTLEIEFEPQVPFHILGWKDAYPSSADKQIRTTTVKLKKRERLLYWEQQKRKEHGPIRERLGLPMDR